MRSGHEPMVMGVLMLPPGVRLTVTVPWPGRVLVPMTHDQDAEPSAETVIGTRPAAMLSVPAGVT
jgi:hypothetical protein